MALDNLLTFTAAATATSSSGANTAAAGTDNSINDAALYASNSITTIGGSAYSPTAYASKTAQISLNDPLVRAMAGIPTGQISFSSFGSKTIYTGTWRSQISLLAAYSVPGVSQQWWGWGANAVTVKSMIFTSYGGAFPSLGTGSVTSYTGNTFVTGNTVGLYEPNSPQGPNQLPVAGVAQYTLSSSGLSTTAYYVFTLGNTAATNVHSLRINANTYAVGNQVYANSGGGYQNFGNVSAGNVGGLYNSTNNMTVYQWTTYGTNSASTSTLANIAASLPISTANVTTFYIT